MFARVAAVVSLALLAAAAPKPGSSTSECNTGSAYCCNQAVAPSSPECKSAAAQNPGFLSILDGLLENDNLLVGLQCSPLNILGGSSTCDASPVCCNDNTSNGLIVVQCIPINLSL